MADSNYRVLTFDGGGVRGLITVILMQRLAAEHGLKDWYKKADLYAGTSTGGLIALGMGKEIPLDQMRDLFVNKSGGVFAQSWVHNIVTLDNLRGAQYGTSFLADELEQWFGAATLSDLPKKVLITTFDLDNADNESLQYNETFTAHKWKPKLFHNLSLTDPGRNAPAAKVGLYTSAAPTYFPVVDGYIDGGVFANNPSMCALAQTQAGKRNSDRHDRPALSKVVLLSLGTGELHQHIEHAGDWGISEWMGFDLTGFLTKRRPLIDILLDGVSGIADFQCAQLLKTRYHRLEPSFGEDPEQDFKLDSASDDEIQAMVEFAENCKIADTVKWLREKWM